MVDHLTSKLLYKKFELISKYIPNVFSANIVTLTGFLIGILAAILISLEFYFIGLVMIIINRFFDGLDGAVSRKNGITKFGGYLDILCDFIFYSAVIFGFAMADFEKNSLAAIFLLFSFVGTGTSFLAFAAIEKKNDQLIIGKEKKAFFYMRGFIEGTETILFYIIVCLLPDLFPIVALIFGIFCWFTVIGRVFSAHSLFR